MPEFQLLRSFDMICVWYDIMFCLFIRSLEWFAVILRFQDHSNIHWEHTPKPNRSVFPCRTRWVRPWVMFSWSKSQRWLVQDTTLHVIQRWCKQFANGASKKWESFYSTHLGVAAVCTVATLTKKLTVKQTQEIQDLFVGACCSSQVSHSSVACGWGCHLANTLY